MNGSSNDSPPILHTKLALLGHLWRHEEDDFGTADIFAFQAQRLWVSSANLTSSSRRNIAELRFESGCRQLR